MRLKEVTVLYKTTFNGLYKYFYYKTLSRSDAEDLTSETFLQFTKAVVAQKDIQDPTKYLYGVAKNVFLAFLREKYSEDELADILKLLNVREPIAAMTEYVETLDAFPTLEERAKYFINQLPQKQKELITLRLIDKLTPTEISRQIGKDTNYVKTTLKRGMKSLKQVIACTPAGTIITE